MKAGIAIKAFALALLLLPTVQSRSQNVVADWDAIASNTIVTVGGKSPAGSFVFFAYVDVAVYDAVNSIDHRHRPFAVSVNAPRGASVDSAVVAAAHDVLVHYFPAQQTVLDADEAASLGAMQNSQAKADGISVGEAVAAQWIALRANDGVEAPIVYTWGSGPGVWQPVPPFPPPVTPWLGQMTPFTYASASDFLATIDPPPSLTSRVWTGDYNLTKAYGALNGSLRTSAQTEIGRFWADHGGAQYSRALRFLIADHNLNTSQSARLAAMQNVSLADSLVACFNAKYHYGFWRPYSAIVNGDTDGNPNTATDPNWLPLDTTPGHPEYPAAHGCGTEALSIALRTFFHSDQVHYLVTSNVTATTHDFARFTDLVIEVDEARIFGGMHYLHSVLQGNVMGTAVACHVLESHFGAECIRDGED
jgi:PAP2 superfamily